MLTGIFKWYLFFLSSCVILQELREEEPSVASVESPVRSAGLTAQLQALRKALYHKYVQEVAALKEQHDGELRRLGDRGEQKRSAEELPEQRGSDGGLDAGRSAGRLEVERTRDRQRVEEEVAKVRRTDSLHQEAFPF